MKTFLVQCNGGIEDIVTSEIKMWAPEAEVKKLYDLKGQLEVSCVSLDTLFRLRTVDKIIEIKKAFNFEKTLDELCEAARELDFEEMNEVESFRISTTRYGHHPFGSNEVQAVVGEVLQNRFNKAVSLKNYDLHIRVDIIARFAIFGIEHTPEKYGKRFEMSYYHRAGIKPTVANALIRMANIKEGETILDPFAGAGTIPMEAAAVYGNKVNIVGGDLYEEVVERASENARLNKLDSYIYFQQMNVFQLDQYVDGPIDKIISNPPYGVKSAKQSNLRRLYRAFILHAAEVMRMDGKMVIMVQRADMMRQTVLRTKVFKITEERVVDGGSLYPIIFVLGKIDEPEQVE